MKRKISLYPSKSIDVFASIRGGRLIVVPLFFIILLFLPSCFVASSSDNPYRTVPTTNNPNIVPSKSIPGGVTY